MFYSHVSILTQWKFVVQSCLVHHNPFLFLKVILFQHSTTFCLNVSNCGPITTYKQVSSPPTKTTSKSFAGNLVNITFSKMAGQRERKTAHSILQRCVIGQQLGSEGILQACMDKP